MSDIDPKIALAAALQRDSELERDFLAEILGSRTRAWRVAWTAISLALLSMFATASIFPLKEPPGMYVVRVDNATGTIEHVTMLGNGQEEYGERIAPYFVHQYVLACEGYDWYRPRVLSPELAVSRRRSRPHRCRSRKRPHSARTGQVRPCHQLGKLHDERGSIPGANGCLG